MSKSPSRPARSLRKSANPDLGSLTAHQHNEAAGAQKCIIVEPAIERAVIADEQVGPGRLIKISVVGPYSLKLLGKAYAPGNKYGFADIVTDGGFIYTASEDNITGAFDSDKWIKVAPDTITGIPADIGDVIPTGRWHNAIDKAGFLVEDDTHIAHNRQRR